MIQVNFVESTRVTIKHPGQISGYQGAEAR